MNTLDYATPATASAEKKPRTRDAAMLTGLLVASMLSFAIALKVANHDNQTPLDIFYLAFLILDAAMAAMLFRWRKHVYLAFAIPAWIWFWFGAFMAASSLLFLI